ncbi:hypothetical protein MJD09_16275 [bacterium]|nr:hypothetical protein [bacterium]
MAEHFYDGSTINHTYITNVSRYFDYFTHVCLISGDRVDFKLLSKNLSVNSMSG